MISFTLRFVAITRFWKDTQTFLPVSFSYLVALADIAVEPFALCKEFSLFEEHLDHNGRVDCVAVGGIEDGRFSAFVIQRGLRGVFYLNDVRILPERCGSHGFYDIAAEIGEHIERVDRLIHKNAAALGCPCAAPAAFCVVCAGALPRNDAARAEECAHLARFDDLFYFEIRGDNAVLEGYADFSAGLFFCFQNFKAFLVTECCRLFKINVSPVAHSVNRHRLVQIMRRADVHDVGLYFFKQFFVIRIGANRIGNGCFCLFNPFWFYITDGFDFSEIVFQNGINMHDGNTAEADYSNFFQG